MVRNMATQRESEKKNNILSLQPHWLQFISKWKKKQQQQTVIEKGCDNKAHHKWMWQGIKNRHNRVGIRIQWELCKLVCSDHANKWYSKIDCSRKFRFSMTLKVKWEDQVINKEKRYCQIVNPRINRKRDETLESYQKLKETAKYWGYSRVHNSWSFWNCA